MLFFLFSAFMLLLLVLFISSFNTSKRITLRRDRNVRLFKGVKSLNMHYSIFL
jgi:hypothetical protein